MQRTSWTPESEASLINLYKAGSSWQDIARALGRTVNACKMRAYVVVPKSDLRGGQGQGMLSKIKNVWTKQEDERMAEMKRQRRSVQEIADELGRSANAVATRAKMLQLRIAPKGSKVAKEKRPCLRCHNPFASTGPGNRICPVCTNTNRNISASPYALHL